jgi:hypothetical protein
MSKAGDPAGIGCDVGVGIEPGRFGRLVAILKAPAWDDGKRMQYMFRRYREEDTDFPTGNYYRSGFLWPTEH